MKGFILSAFVIIFGFSTLNAKELKLKSGNVDLRNQSSLSATKLGLDASTETPKYFVVQFNKVTEAAKNKLASQGIELLQYLPDDAFIARGDYQKAMALTSQDSNIYAVHPYQADWKLDEEFFTMSVLDQNNDQILNIRTLPKTSIDKVAQQFSQIPQVRILSAEGRTLIVKTNKLRALELSKVDGVEFIETQPQIEFFDFKIFGDGERAGEPDDLGHPTTGYESGTKIMNFDAAWKRGFTGQNQIVAMADTGLDTGVLSNLHPDLHDVLEGESVALFGNGWADYQGHGTHVTGSVISRGNMSNGLIKGGAFNAGYFPQGMWSTMFNNIMVPKDLSTMFQSAYNKGARIHTNSWGATGNFGAYDNMAASVDAFMWDHPDFLILFAAGNSGVDANKDGVIDYGSVSFPGTAKNCLTVGASENMMTAGGRQKSCDQMRNGDKNWGVAPIKGDFISNNPNGIACFSSRGPTKDQRIKPEIVSPGTNIVSLHDRFEEANKDVSVWLWGKYDDNYSWAGGTSMATPLTAGAAAVTREFLQKKGFQTPSAALMKAMLIHHATDIFPGQFGTGQGQEIPTTRPNNVEGYGRTNMDAVTKDQSLKIIDEVAGIGTGESFDVRVPMNKKKKKTTTKFVATLVYTDAPAAASASKTLINDLDLVVVAPDGKIFTSNDHTNNSEIVEIPVSTGTYAVSVKGNNVPQGKNGKQPFALVIGTVD